MFKFSSLASARSFVRHCKKSMAIIMGDGEKFWVVTLRQMEKLIRDGYEVAK